MNLLNKIKEEDINKLCSHVKELFEELRPVFENIDPDKISDKSKIEISPTKDEYALHISIEPKEKNLPGFALNAGKSHFFSYYFGHPFFECPSDPEADFGYLVNVTVDYTTEFLNGYTIVEYYNKKNKLIKKQFYFGISPENDERELRGGGKEISFRFFSKVHTTKKITYKFTKEC